MDTRALKKSAIMAADWILNIAQIRDKNLPLIGKSN